MNVCFVYSNRAEFSLLSPFIEYFKSKTHTVVINLQNKIKKIEKDENLGKIYLLCYKEFIKKSFDYIIILGDRRELPFIAFAALFSDSKIVHIASGEDVTGLPTYDQFIRPTVTILSNNQICFSKKAQDNTKKIFRGINNFKQNSKVIGNPVFKNIEIDKLKRKEKKDYDLVLLHPQSLSQYETKKDVNEIKKKIKNKNTIFISGNKDKNFDIIEKFYKRIEKNAKYQFYENLPKKDYFRLVKYCDKFYTNTSSISEIEKLNKKAHVNIGKRNLNRTKMKLDENAPEKLFQHLRSK
jgi:UDP-N-acetylglucosamine 2-epimerase